jgi:hydrogenase assembly chaperone HypC/HupF
MCLVVPYRVVAFLPAGVEVESADGQRIVVDASLTPDVAIDTYVLVDRGIVIETITSEEAQAILDMYREIASLLDTEDALT